jgi:hypothetical protein
MQSTCIRSRSRMPRLPIAALLSCVAASGCMTAKYDETRTLPTHIEAGEGVVILAKPKVDGVTAEDDFMDCVAGKLAADSIKILPNDAFMDQLFPWFEPAVAPQRAEGVARLLAHKRVADRVAETGVRYVVWVDGSTRKTDGGGSFSCAVGPGMAGCLGFGWWEKESAYEAVVWDLQTAKSTGSVSANVTGTSALIGVLVPVPIIARVQNQACGQLAGQLTAFLRGQDAAMAGAATP